jgi:anti-anti-sigma regulatory factor
MSLEKKETEHFIYLSYSRSDFKDVEEFKKELGNLAAKTTCTKDVVVDCTLCKYMASAELGALVRFVNDLRGTERFLRVIPSKELHKTMLSINLQKIEHLVIYANKKAFAEQLLDPNKSN